MVPILPFWKKRKPAEGPTSAEDAPVGAGAGKPCWSCNRASIAPGYNAANERICDHCGARIDYPG